MTLPPKCFCKHHCNLTCTNLNQRWSYEDQLHAPRAPRLAEKHGLLFRPTGDEVGQCALQGFWLSQLSLATEELEMVEAEAGEPIFGFDLLNMFNQFQSFNFISFHQFPSVSWVLQNPAISPSRRAPRSPTTSSMPLRAPCPNPSVPGTSKWPASRHESPTRRWAQCFWTGPESTHRILPAKWWKTMVEGPTVLISTTPVLCLFCIRLVSAAIFLSSFGQYCFGWCS